MTPSPSPQTQPSITIRRATQADLRDLDRLARLDSQRLTPGPHLVALSDDRLVAAIDLHDGRWIADPFELTDDVVDLLRERAGHITRPQSRRAPRTLGLVRGLFPAAVRRA
jgi:ketosteroid isomerase-like protein